MTLPSEFAATVAALRVRGEHVTVHWYDQVPSTMDVAARLADEGARHGTIVIADAQTAGRGRRGNAWASPPGAGLYFSFVARPSPNGVALLTLAAGVGVREGILASTGLVTSLKWPNDVLVGRRKLAGILAEAHAIGTPQQTVIVGVGVNVRPAAYPPEVTERATSLESELGAPVDRATVFTGIVAALSAHLAALDESPGDILHAWRAASPSATGTRVEWDRRAGVTAGIDDAGALLVQTDAGVERIVAGELQWHLTS